MRLHADAALSWSGRRLLVEWVLVEGWTLQREVGWAVSRGRSATAGSRVGAAPGGELDASRPCRGDRVVAAVADDAGSATTTIDDDTQPSATNHRSAEPTSLGPTANRHKPHGARTGG